MDEEDKILDPRGLLALGIESEELFDAIVRVAQTACSADYAVLTLVDAQRAWVAAKSGDVAELELARAMDFCLRSTAVDGVFEMADVPGDPRLQDDLIVAGSEGVRFYAGAPVEASDGHRIGVLCVMGRGSSRLDASGRNALASHAKLASLALGMRGELLAKAATAQAEHVAKLVESEQLHRSVVEARSEMVCLFEFDGTIVYASPAFLEHVHPDATADAPPRFFECLHRADRAPAKARVALAVVSQHVVPIEAKASDGWTVGEGRVWSMPVVVLHPRPEFDGSMV